MSSWWRPTLPAALLRMMAAWSLRAVPSPTFPLLPVCSASSSQAGVWTPSVSLNHLTFLLRPCTEYRGSSVRPFQVCVSSAVRAQIQLHLTVDISSKSLRLSGPQFPYQ